jgi:hypothetical protein
MKKNVDYVSVAYGDIANVFKKVMFELDQLSTLNIECRDACRKCKYCYIINKNNMLLHKQISCLMQELVSSHRPPTIY